MENDTQATGTDAPAVADTADTQASSADVQTNNEAPEAAQDTKDSELTATDTADEKLYAGKYKSVEDMEKAYTELQSKFGQTTSEKAELSRILNEAFATDTSTGAADEYTEEEAVSANPKEDVRDRKIALLEFTTSHPDAVELGDEMVKVLNSDPRIKDISSYEAKLEYAYLRSQNIARPKAIAEAEKRAAEQTQAKVAEKQTAQVESANKSEKTDENAEIYERATGNYSAADRKQARLEVIRRNLVNL